MLGAVGFRNEAQPYYTLILFVNDPLDRIIIHYFSNNGVGTNFGTIATTDAIETRRHSEQRNMFDGTNYAKNCVSHQKTRNNLINPVSEYCLTTAVVMSPSVQFTAFLTIKIW